MPGDCAPALAQQKCQKESEQEFSRLHVLAQGG